MIRMMLKKSKKFYVYFIISVFLMLLIFFFSSQTGEESSEVSNAVLRFILEKLSDILPEAAALFLKKKYEKQHIFLFICRNRRTTSAFCAGQIGTVLRCMSGQCGRFGRNTSGMRLFCNAVSQIEKIVYNITI